MINFPTLIIDNFYNDPDKIREFALKLEYEDSPGNYPGKRTKFLHELNRELFIGFCSKFFQVYYPAVNIEWNVYTSFWKVSTLDPNPLSPKNMGWIHEDNCIVAGVVYLSPEINNKLGTTIYKKVSERKKINVSSMKKFYSTGIDDNFDESITNNNSMFEETMKIDNVYNRMICFDGNVSHSPSHYYMENQTRLVQVFFVHNIKSQIMSPIRRIQQNDNIPYYSL